MSWLGLFIGLVFKLGLEFRDFFGCFGEFYLGFLFFLNIFGFVFMISF